MLQAMTTEKTAAMPPAVSLKARRFGYPPFDHPDSEERERRVRLAVAFVVSRVFGVDSRSLWQANRGEQHIANARQVAMYLAHVCCGLSMAEVGRLFGRDRKTVSHGCVRIEVKRNNPQFDRALDLLGWALPPMVQRSPDNFFRH